MKTKKARRRAHVDIVNKIVSGFIDFSRGSSKDIPSDYMTWYKEVMGVSQFLARQGYTSHPEGIEWGAKMYLYYRSRLMVLLMNHPEYSEYWNNQCEIKDGDI